MHTGHGHYGGSENDNEAHEEHQQDVDLVVSSVLE
jgi:hypothetical protein